MSDQLNRTPQTRSAYMKAFTVLLGLFMILGTVGLWAYGAQLRGRVTGAMNLAATMNPRHFVPAEVLSKKIELDEEQKATRTESDGQFTDLLKSHPVFGAPPQAGPPQANIQAILGDMALINNKWLKVGETQDGVKLVMTMTSGRALVEIEGKQREVNVFSAMPNKPLPAGPPSLNSSGGSDRGGRSDRSSSGRSGGPGGPGGNSTFTALRDAFTSKKDFRNDKELMGKLGKMDNKELYKTYQNLKSSGVNFGIPDSQIEDFFSKGGFKGQNKIFDGGDNKSSGPGISAIPFGGSKSSRSADDLGKPEKKSAKALDPDRIAKIKAAKAGRSGPDSGPPSPKRSASEKSAAGPPPKSSAPPSFEAPGLSSGRFPSGKKTKNNRPDRSAGENRSSFPPVMGGSVERPAPASIKPRSPVGSLPDSGPPAAKLKPKAADRPFPPVSRPLSPKALERSAGGGSGSSSRSDGRPSPSGPRSKTGGSSGSPARPSPSELRSKSGSSGSGSGSGSASRPSPGELRTQSGGGSPGSSIARDRGPSSGGPSGSSKSGTRSFYPGSRGPKGGSSITGIDGPKGKKGKRKVQSPYRNN